MKKAAKTVFSYLEGYLKEQKLANTQKDIASVLGLKQPNVATYMASDPKGRVWKSLYSKIFNLGEKHGRAETNKTLFDVIQTSYEVKNQLALARLLGVKQPQISNWLSGNGAITKKSFNKILNNHTARIFNKLIEFERCQPDKRGSSWKIGSKNDQSLKAKIEGKVGVYAFYDSAGKIIYFGKSHSCLYKEICQRLNGKYNRIVYLPEKRNDLKQGDFVRYISVVEVLVPAAIKNIESFVLRTIPNDDANSSIGNYEK